MTDALDLDRPAAARPDPRDEARRLAHLFSGSAAELDRSGAFPRANIEALSAAGLLNLVIGREHGGHGAGLRLARDIISEIARGEPSTALIVAMHYLNHAAIRYSRRWPDHLARQLVRDSLCGPALVNALQVEPGAGSPSYGTLPRTIARRTETGWRLTGRKTFATGCEGLAWFIVLAVTDEPQPRIGSFVVSHLSPGIHIERTWDTVGMRATGSHDVTFRDIAVPHADVLDLAPASEGIRRDEQQTAWFMLLIGAVYHGIALAARDDVLAFALDFRPGDLKEPLSSLPRIQDELGAIEVLLISNERLLNSVARDFDEDVPIGPDSGAVRHAVIENAIRVVDLALTIAGNAGVSRNHALERHHRNVICGRTHAPTGPLVRAAAARAAISRAVKTRTAST
ncbi:acyl-CoA dehydrogenase family protein [Bradyrhizobium sp. BTAi1]|uniref:acyl-CoA dehydrogenase family protein n=1 Tax=Bradyrhizobium sp. (strain BTAi1 / ATCC BAA-1182) TaxID=288000 RepID=UPI00005DFF78|nr:acyl-CoA dehydrogenase family protein [Bradyrhizobium sp. BTAi1]ABQ34737.1 putative acyl-CoA dehydrogenase [Bradyrhizobium sp. BTAi1]